MEDKKLIRKKVKDEHINHVEEERLADLARERQRELRQIS